MFVSNDGYRAGINLEFVSDVIIYASTSWLERRDLACSALLVPAHPCITWSMTMNWRAGCAPVKDCIAALNL
jgi:hypothetical protein